MKYKLIIRPDGSTVVYSNSATDLVRLIRELRVTPSVAQSQPELWNDTEDSKSEQGGSNLMYCFKNLLTLIGGSRQEQFFDILANYSTGITRTALKKLLQLRSIYELAGVWSGLVKNCKKSDIDIHLLIKRGRNETGDIIYKPTAEFVRTWKAVRS